MDEQEKVKKIKKLTRQEIKALYYKKRGDRGYNLEKNADASESTIFNTQRVAFDKLGIPNIKGKEKKRWTEFKDGFGDTFDTLVPDEVTAKTWPMDGNLAEETTPESQTEPTPEPTPKPPPPSSSVRAIPLKPPRRPPTWLLAFMACSVLGVIAIIVFVLAIILIREIRPAYQIPPTQIPLPTSESAVVVQPLVPTNTLQPTSSPLPTDTLVPTNTPYPTDTPPPTNTPRPSISLPFEDNFDSGINPVWTIMSGDWMTANGRLTLIFDDYSFRWINLNESQWTNYIVRANVDRSVGQVAIVVRNQPGNTPLAYLLSWYGINCWVFYEDNDFDKCIYEERRDANKQVNLMLTVSGNDYIAVLDGIEHQRITLTDRSNGGVAIAIWCQSGFPCPSVDNFKVESIP